MWEEGVPGILGEDAHIHFLPLYSDGPTASCSSSTDQPSDRVVSPCLSHGFLLSPSACTINCVCLSIHLSHSFCLLCSLPLFLPTSLHPSLFPCSSCHPLFVSLWATICLGDPSIISHHTLLHHTFPGIPKAPSNLFQRLLCTSREDLESPPKLHK